MCATFEAITAVMYGDSFLLGYYVASQGDRFPDILKERNATIFKSLESENLRLWQDNPTWVLGPHAARIHLNSFSNAVKQTHCNRSTEHNMTTVLAEKMFANYN
jgi:hypothetical protein